MTFNATVTLVSTNGSLSAALPDIMISCLPFRTTSSRGCDFVDSDKMAIPFFIIGDPSFNVTGTPIIFLTTLV